MLTTTQTHRLRSHLMTPYDIYPTAVVRFDSNIQNDISTPFYPVPHHFTLLVSSTVF